VPHRQQAEGSESVVAPLMVPATFEPSATAPSQSAPPPRITASLSGTAPLPTDVAHELAASFAPMPNAIAAATAAAGHSTPGSELGST